MWDRLNRDTCIPLVGERTYRTWLLLLAGSACSFETGGAEAFSVPAVKSESRG
jgi:cyclopropane fatty-acyl-phospholipid synthase-like methyltransferase